MSNQQNTQLTHSVRQQCAEGYALYDAGAYENALRLFYQAWLTIPKPQTDWMEAGWVLTAIGDCYFRLGRFQPGRESLESALCCPQAADAPFIHLRLGQCLWELGETDRARHRLNHAHRLGGDKLFEKEAEHYRLAALTSPTGAMETDR